VTNLRRYYTVEEANAQLGKLSALFEQVLQLRAQIKRLSGELGGDGASELDLARLNGLVEAAADVVREIDDTGCVIKDLSVGLVDWPALHQGREVWLCWRYGEPEVAYWHELHSGFAGRRPIDELSPAMTQLLH